MVEAAFAARPSRKTRKRKPKPGRARCMMRGCNRYPAVLVPPMHDGSVSETEAPEGHVDALCKTHAKREADRLCRLVVLDRDNHTCQRCGGTEAIQWAHVLSRSELSLRWLPENSLALCAKCHVYMTHRPVEWMDWVDNHYREDRIGQLRIWRLDAVSRGDKPDYAEIIASLRSQAAGLVR